MSAWTYFFFLISFTGQVGLSDEAGLSDSPGLPAAEATFVEEHDASPESPTADAPLPASSSSSPAAGPAQNNDAAALPPPQPKMASPPEPKMASPPVAASPLPPGGLRQAKPTPLLESLAHRSPASQLSGIPLSLVDAVAGCTTRQDQSRRVRLYWELAIANMEYDLALLELSEFNLLVEGILQPGRAWAVANEAARADTEARLQTARAWQYQMQQELGRGPSEPLVLPSDLPHSGAYATRFAELFAGRELPEATHLNVLLDGKHTALTRQAARVHAALQWLSTVSAERSSHSDGEELLQAYQAFASARRLFLRDVEEYNQHLVRYAQLAIPELVGPERLVAMLIKTPHPPEQDFEPDAIRRTSAEEPSGSLLDSNTATEPDHSSPRSRTDFSEIENGVERSILVN